MPQSDCAARRIYIDMGTNWANTLRLHEDLAHLTDGVPGTDGDTESGTSTQWQVVGFEASPLIWPYVDRFVTYLNGAGPRPTLCVPPAGSSTHLEKYTKAYGCASGGMTCMFKRLKLELDRLRPDPKLNGSALVQTRLRDAVTCFRGARARIPADGSSFSFIPAGVGTVAGWMDVYSPPRQLIRGGSVDLDGKVMRAIGGSKTLDLNNGMSAGEGARDHTYRVPVADVVGWMERTLRERDLVILKMDVEGAEQSILEAMIDRDLLRRIDVLSLEGWSPLRQALRARGANLTAPTVEHRSMDNGALDASLRTAVERFSPALKLVSEDCRSRDGRKLVPGSPTGPSGLLRCSLGNNVAHSGIDSKSKREAEEIIIPAECELLNASSARRGRARAAAQRQRARTTPLVGPPSPDAGATPTVPPGAASHTAALRISRE